MYFLMSPFLLNVEKFGTYEEALERKMVIGNRAWTIWFGEEIKEVE